MYNLRIFFLFIFITIISIGGKCQIDLEKLFTEKGEVYFQFENPQSVPLEKLTRIVSIDNVSNKSWVKAYANKKEFEQFLSLNIPFEILPNPGDITNPVMKDNVNLKEINDWDFYPTYEAYIDLMYQFEEDYPDLCDVFSIGTSIEGRQLMFAKISNNVSAEEGEARVLYTSSIHGDELTGYVLMLRYIDYLLSNYNENSKVTNLVNNLEIWINPLANPDGTYTDGNSSVQGAKRFNANNVDINRNFPDPEDGEHPDGNPWQKETIEFMELADSVAFVLSANFHGGAEVFNYPWDTWSQLHADDDWWQLVGREWADTVHANAPSGYFNDLDNGITNGYAWYSISGGRQDFMNYFHQCREVTLEISNIKLLPANQLPEFWEYNYRSFLNYFEQALYGLKGSIIDSVSGEPIAAAVFIEDHDMDNSWVSSNPTNGKYYRPLYEGLYEITFSATGYQTKTYNQVYIESWEMTSLDVELVYTGSGIHDINTSGLFQLGPNPSNGRIILSYFGHESIDCEICIVNVAGKTIENINHSFSNASRTLEVDLNKQSIGIYFISITSDSFSFSEKIIVR